MLCVNIIQALDEILDEHGVSTRMDVIYLKEHSEVVNAAFRKVYSTHEVPMYNIISALDPYTPAETILSKVVDSDNREIIRMELKELMSSKSISRKSI